MRIEQNLEGKAKAYFLVRDNFGKPKVDGDPRELPTQIKQAMTDEEYNLAVHEYDTEGLDADS